LRLFARQIDRAIALLDKSAWPDAGISSPPRLMRWDGYSSIETIATFRATAQGCPGCSVTYSTSYVVAPFIWHTGWSLAILAAMSDVTRILSQIEQGDPQAAGHLLPLVYDELRKLAAARLAAEKPGNTLSATSLVHEAYLRLVGGGDSLQWQSRGHFFAAAAEAMRRILVEAGRRRNQQRRGAGLERVDLDNVDLAIDYHLDDLLMIDEALTSLQQSDSELAELVKLHCFAGLTIEQTASVLQISVRTAYRDWAYARAWLFRKLTDGEQKEGK
jgi:RNA polymerase sigma factor (TIGR02999 family)